MAERLKDKVAIVTGAGSRGPGIGNGKATAILFAREGAKVLCVDSEVERAQQTVAEIQKENATAMAFAADVTRAADCKAMVGQAVNRWGGLEQEGFGIVFVEAAACGVPQVAGDSGGAADAVVDGETGLVVRRPDDVGEAVAALRRLLDDDTELQRMGKAARRRAEAEFSYEVLSARLGAALGV